MRLHQLTVTAFGPFPGTESVDFDALNDAGLFLLTGATGAGKTSILDAVCFGLYGSVPGVRGVKALKSQHAGEHVVPEVVLEFSVRDRRFRVRRSPEWSRPKRRGHGTRTENACACLVELTGGVEHFLSSRAAEVGLLVGDLVGMRSAQFQQVAMLPQGEFARFLHASSQQRHDVLQHLFRTDRFARIEEWVNDHSRTVRERAAAAEETVRRLLHTVADRGDGIPAAAAEQSAPPEELPEELPEPPLDEPLDVATALGRVDELCARAGTHHESLEARRRAAQRAVVAARSVLEEGRRVAECVERRDRAVAELGVLAEGDAEAEAATAALAADARAGGCRALLPMLEESTAELDRLTAERATALAVLRTDPALAGEDLGDLDVDALDCLADATRGFAGRVEALLPRARALPALAADATAAEADLAAARTAAHEARQDQLELPARLAQARERLDRENRLASRVDALTLRLAAARERAAAVAALPAATSRLTLLRDEVRDLRDAAADAREEVQSLVAARLAGMAAELAGQLHEGAPCQVCGSTSHPLPAVSTERRVTDEQQREAQRRLESRQAALVGATERAADAEAQVRALAAAAEHRDQPTADAETAALADELTAAQAAAARESATAAEVEGLAAALARAEAAATAAERAAAVQEQRHAAATASLDRARAEVAEALPDVDPSGLPSLAEAGRRTLGALARARVVLLRHEQAVRRTAEVSAQAEAAATAHGFDSVAALRAALLDDAARGRLEALVRQREARAAAARAVLAEPDVLAAGDVAAVDLRLLGERVELAEAEARARAREADLQAERLVALSDLRRRLQAAVADWEPVQQEHARAESMARLVRGTGADNQLQMRLSAYVLATRLDQVLEAANERLAHMRDQRYLLQRTGRAARKGSQAGLGLEVVDQWTGDVRDPATLSGGETFVVSLSLALGLADVVTQEAGGAEIETLFVDEGFGTLDPDTLDDVMDRLDGLRVGGRTVGVVSHVAELRTRIPAQVHVRKTPAGSTVHARTLVG